MGVGEPSHGRTVAAPLLSTGRVISPTPGVLSASVQAFTVISEVSAQTGSHERARDKGMTKAELAEHLKRETERFTTLYGER